MRVIQLWLNGKQDYFTGLVLFAKHTDDTGLLALLRNGPTPYNTARLLKEMEALLLPVTEKQTPPPEKKSPVISLPKETLPAVNEELYAVAKAEANMVYKEAMNMRAELFALARVENWEDANQPDKIQQRSALAIETVIKYNEASSLYDRADNVRRTGRLQVVEQDEQDEYDALPDFLVKKTLDNVRKNYNKMKKRPQSADRVELQQKHEKNIKKLEARWQSLKIKANQ